LDQVVPVEQADESHVDASTAEAVGSDIATPAFDESTYKKKIQGYTSAINQTKAEAKQLAAEVEALRKWRAEREQADMSEFEKAQARIAALEAEVSATKAQATAATLARQYPRAAELLGDDLGKFDATRVAEIDGRLAQEAEAEASEPRIDANSPRRSVPKPPADTASAARQALVAAGNPYFNESEWR
jgi:hypothetical protein